MEFGAGKVVHPQQSSSPGGKQQGLPRGVGAVSESISISRESVAVSIPIRAPVSDDIEEEEDDGGSFGTEEDECDFESAPERIASPAGSLADGNPTFWYSQSALGPPDEFRTADPAREMFLSEVVHEKGSSSDDEVWPLARVKLSLGSAAGGSSSLSSSAVLLQATMPVAKLSGDDDEDGGGDGTETDEDEVFEDLVEEEEEEEGDYGDFSVAKVSPYSVLGGLRVAGFNSGQILKSVESEPNDGQPGILEKSIGKLDNSEAYPNAMSENLSSEAEQVGIGTRGVGLEERMEESVNPTGEESGAVTSAKEGVLGNADVNKQGVAGGVEGIADSTVSVDAPGSVDCDSVRREVADIGKDGIEEIPAGGYEPKQQESIENVGFESFLESRDLGDDALLDSNADVAEGDAIGSGKERDEGRESEADDVQEAMEDKVLASAVERGSEDLCSGEGLIDQEVVVGPVKVANDADGGASGDFYSEQDEVAEPVAVDTGERSNGWETNEGKVMAAVNVGDSENSVIKQEGCDREDIIDSGKVVCDDSFMSSDSMLEKIVPDEGVLSGEEVSSTPKAGPDDVQETEGGENTELKLLNFADARQEEEVGSGFDSQGCQNVGEFKGGTDVFHGQMPGSLKSREDKESKGTRGGSDACGSVQIDTTQPQESREISTVLEEGDGIVNPQTGKAVFFDKVLLNSDSRSQFEFEVASVDDQYVQNVDGSLIANWVEEVDDDEEEEDEEMVESSALAALMEAARSVGTGYSNASFGAAGFSVSTRPVGLGSSVPSLDPTPRSGQHIRSNGTASTRPSALVEDNQHGGDSDDGYGETQEKLQMIRVKFLRLVERLGQSPQNVVVTQVLYRLGLAEGIRRGSSINRASGFDRARAVAEQQEAAGIDLDFICNIMVLGKTGVGKSATINSIFDEIKSTTDAFQPATNKVQEILGTIHSIKVRVIDTPGLMLPFADQRRNKNILSSVKKFVKKFPPDIVLYFDRLDMQGRDYSDVPLLKNITDTFGAAIWLNAIVVLTHAASAPPDGRNGAPLSYEMFVTHRSHEVQHSIRQAAGDMRLMNPVSLVENHSSCRTNREGQRVLPNGQIWKPQLLLLCFASKVLAEANSLLKLEESTPGRLFGVRTRGPPLPFLLSSLLQSRAQLKIPDEQGGEDAESDDDYEELTDPEDGDEYDRLPPFRHLRKSQLSKLTKEQRKAYLDEIDYREKLFQKKQWKEALRRRRNVKKMPPSSKEESQATDEDFDEGNERAAPVAVPMPDMAIPLTFDSDNQTYRYRYLDTASQWLVRPVLDTHGWDHDIGYDGLNVETMFVIGNRVPASIASQITKDKKEASLQLECAASLKHGEHKATQIGFDVQTVGKDLAYTLRSETRFNNFKCNKTTGGLALTLLGDTLATGLKLEDGLTIGKRLKLVVNGGAMTGRGNMAYGGSLEATLRDKDYPVGQTLTTLGLSVMQWHGDLAIGGNLQSQIPVGRKMTMIARANLNNKGSGQISIRTSSSEQLQIALIGIIPLIRMLTGGRLFGESHSTQ